MATKNITIREHWTTCLPEMFLFKKLLPSKGYNSNLPRTVWNRLKRCLWKWFDLWSMFALMIHIVSCSRIPDSVGKDIEKACQSIYPLHDVYVRKVKMLKKPKFECKRLMSLTTVVLLDLAFQLVGRHDDKLFRSQMITWLLPIEISWHSLTRGEKLYSIWRNEDIIITCVLCCSGQADGAPWWRWCRQHCKGNWWWHWSQGGEGWWLWTPHPGDSLKHPDLIKKKERNELIVLFCFYACMVLDSVEAYRAVKS